MVSGSNNFQQPVELEKYLYVLQQRNLVYNYDFRYYSNQVRNGSTIEYGTPDGYIYSDPGRNGKIGFDPESKSCVIVKSEDNSLMRFSQALHEFPRWQSMLLNQTITAKIHLNISTENEVSLVLSDGIDSNTITKKASGDVVMEVQLKINEKAQSVTVSCESSAAFVTLKISKIYANVGEIAMERLPCIVQGIIGERRQYISTETPPAEELSLCQPSQELGKDFTRLSSVINNRFGSGSGGRSLLPDMRGYFSRSWDNGAGTDPDANNRTALGQGKVTGDHIGTVENDDFLQHDHELQFSTDKPILTGKEGAATIVNTTNTSKTKKSGGKETRPKNLTELYTIKWA